MAVVMICPVFLRGAVTAYSQIVGLGAAGGEYHRTAFRAHMCSQCITGIVEHAPRITPGPVQAGRIAVSLLRRLYLRL